MAGNKVTFGLTNVHYAIVNENEDGTITYEKPVRIFGAVSMTETPLGEKTTFPADNGIYYQKNSNQGYERVFTFAELPESFKVDVLGKRKVNGGLAENANAKQKAFALLYEIDGDEEADKFVNYYCTAGRPSGGTTTKGETVEINTKELTVAASPRPTDGEIEWVTGPETPQAIKDAFFDAVVEPYEAGVA